MGRLLLLLLVVLGGALYFPETRARLLDRVQPLTEPLMRPIKVGSTREELRQVGRDLAEVERRFGRIPRDRDAFRDWLYDQYATEENIRDSWGGVYGYQLWPDSFAIRSDGPDGTERTGDDIVVVRPRVPRRDRR